MDNSVSPAPADRIVDFDVYHPDPSGQDYEAAWIALRDRSKPVMWTTRNGGHWIATRGKVIRDILADHEHFSSRILMAPREQGLTDLLPTAVDPPVHVHYRSLINKAFSPQAVRATEPEIRAYSVELIERIKPRGACDFMRDFARMLPIVVFFKLANLPLADHEKLHHWMEQLMRPDGSMSQEEAMGNYADYLRPVIHARRTNPQGDLISTIAAGQVQGRPMTDDEAIRMCTTMLLGGLDTVLALMSFVMRYLATDAVLRKRLIAHPERIGDAVEEFLRRFPVGANTREIKTDFVLDGVQLSAGQLITTPQILHALDDSEFPDPEKVDIDRATAGHSAFGHGVHKCPGAFLARSEIRLLLEEWLPRIPDFELDPNEKIVVSTGITTGIFKLPLRWSVA